MITSGYADLNRHLHETNPRYGTSGRKWADTVRALAAELGTDDILDYGCGKRTLQEALPEFTLKHYDPAVPGVDTPPDRADIVVCTDVLEHVEPECLDSVLDDLARLTLRRAFLTIATRPAVKFLADGRNAHLIQEPFDWWLPKLEQRFRVISCHTLDLGEFSVLAAPRVD